jgi:hypothetical protein
MYYAFRRVRPNFRYRLLFWSIEKTVALSKPALGGSGVNDTNPAIDKLRRIQKLWVELGRTKLDSPAYQEIMKNSRSLSAEYQSLVEASQKPGKSK